MEEKLVNKNSKPKDQERREFIKKSTLIGAGVAATTMSSAQAVAGISNDQPEPAEQKGYQLTSHVLDYYKSASI